MGRGTKCSSSGFGDVGVTVFSAETGEGSSSEQAQRWFVWGEARSPARGWAELSRLGAGEDETCSWLFYRKQQKTLNSGGLQEMPPSLHRALLRVGFGTGMHLPQVVLCHPYGGSSLQPARALVPMPRTFSAEGLKPAPNQGAPSRQSHVPCSYPCSGFRQEH